MNIIREETNQNNNTNNIFTSIQWNQGPPHYSPWGHSPNSPPATLVTFNAPVTNIEMDQGEFGLNSQLIGSTNHFGHNIRVSDSGQPQPVASTSSYGDKPLLHCKRKANIDFSIPNKQHITEEKMAQHMSRLHISSESHLDLEVQSSELEDTSTRQKRLYVCDEMRRLQTENILPTALLGRLERPCMAVMLWQPPAKIPELIGPSTSTIRFTPQPPQRQPRPLIDEDENDNSSGTVNLNNMDMDS